MNLNQVTIFVSDVERSIAFYETLGLRLIVRSLPKYARFECPDGNSTFSLHVGEREAGIHGAWIYFESETLDQTVETLAQRGLSFDELPEDKPWLWREARLRDPDGHTIILYHAGKNRKNPPWRLS